MFRPPRGLRLFPVRASVSISTAASVSVALSADSPTPALGLQFLRLAAIWKRFLHGTAVCCKSRAWKYAATET